MSTVLLNGIPFYDLDYISKLGTKEIRKIEVNQSRVMFGDITFYGIISIITNDGKIPSSYFNNERFVFKNIVNLPDTETESGMEKSIPTNEKNLPDLRQTLYFNRKLQLLDHHKAEIKFSTSELQTQYSILIQGITESGIPVSTSTLINVK